MWPLSSPINVGKSSIHSAHLFFCWEKSDEIRPEKSLGFWQSFGSHLPRKSMWDQTFILQESFIHGSSNQSQSRLPNIRSLDCGTYHISYSPYAHCSPLNKYFCLARGFFGYRCRKKHRLSPHRDMTGAQTGGYMLHFKGDIFFTEGNLYYCSGGGSKIFF